MAKQERAERTRRILVEAAVDEIDRNGYERASLVRICRAAKVSMGALTFHFSTKGELADELSALGAQLTRRTVDRVTCSGLSFLGVAVEVTLEVARLLEGEALVRAAARLARERPQAAGGWTGVWLPPVRDFLHRAHEGGQLHPDASPDLVTALVVHLLAGAEISVREAAWTGSPAPERASVQLERILRLVLYCIAAPSH